MSVILSVYHTVSYCLYVSVFLFVCLFVGLSCLSIILSVYMDECVSVSLSVYAVLFFVYLYIFIFACRFHLIVYTSL